MRLTTKLSLLLCGLSIVALSLTVSFLHVSERRHLLSGIGQAQEEAVRKLAQVCADSVLEGNELSRLSYLKTFWAAAEPGTIAFVVFLDEQGRVLMHSDFIRGDLSLLNARPREEALARAMEAEDMLRQESPGLVLLSAPVRLRDRRAGTVAIAYDDGALRGRVARLQRESLARSLQAVFLGVGLSVLLAALLARALARPIRRLAEAARRIGGGDLGCRVPAGGQDELSDLAREFNSMAQKLGELDAMKDGFLAQITHDLKNPLSAMLGAIELIRIGAHGPANEKQLKDMEIAARSGAYLSELIDNILDLTKLEAGRMQFKIAPVDLKACAQEAAEVLDGRAAEYGVSLDLVGVPEGTLVQADGQALRRVLLNLLSNALKFTPSGGRVSVSWSRGPSGEDRISVSDTGIGIPEGKIQALFQKFSQVEETRNKVREARGTGLGLAICKQIVEAHGGGIRAESRYRRGATFIFTLPRA